MWQVSVYLWQHGAEEALEPRKSGDKLIDVEHETGTEQVETK